MSNTTLAGARSSSTRNAVATVVKTAVAGNAGSKMFDLLESQSGAEFESIAQRSNSHMNTKSANKQ